MTAGGAEKIDQSRNMIVFKNGDFTWHINVKCYKSKTTVLQCPDLSDLGSHKGQELLKGVLQ